MNVFFYKALYFFFFIFVSTHSVLHVDDDVRLIRLISLLTFVRCRTPKSTMPKAKRTLAWLSQSICQNNFNKDEQVNSNKKIQSVSKLLKDVAKLSFVTEQSQMLTSALSPSSAMFVLWFI